MKCLTCVLNLCLIAATSLAQVPVKKDLLEVLGKVPPPPANVNEAYERVDPGPAAGSLACKADRLFGSVEREIGDIERTYEAQAKGAAAGVPPGVPADLAAQMQDPEFRKKMKSMTKEEKMKMAMEMSKSMPAGAPAMEKDPPPVQEALAEWNKIIRGVEKALDESAAAEQEAARLKEEDSRAHKVIDEWAETEIGKLPQISSGEMSAPDPAAVRVVRLRACDKHIDQANKALAGKRTSWTALLERTKTQFGPFHQKLVAADYASASKNFGTLKTLSDGQMVLLKRIDYLTQDSRAAYEESARWVTLRKRTEKE